MSFTDEDDSPPAPASGGTVSGATTYPDNDTAQPSLTSGFGSVMEQEHELQSSTENSLGQFDGPRSAAIEDILHKQRARLGANIALLEQRYEMLANPVRFKALHATPSPPAQPRSLSVAEEPIGLLARLATQHFNVLRNIETLIGQRPDGQRGELILNEIARNHEEMAWMLTALLKEDETVLDRGRPSIQAGPPPATSEGNWENEGGAVETAAAGSVAATPGS